MSASDVARRIAAFEFASRASDLIFGNVYALPRVPRPSVRDGENPMERYNDGQFLARYRFTKGTVRELLATLPLQASADNRGLSLPPMLQLLVTLRFYGAGAFQIVTGDLVNVSQPTVCRTVGVVTRLIARHLFKKLVHFPDASQLNNVRREFFEIAGFPGVTGCIDCTHVRINSPGGDDAEVYRNRKGVFSINVQSAVEDHLERKNGGKLHIYLGGSVNRTRTSSTAAFCIPETGAEWSGKLEVATSSTTAEQVAIEKALNAAAELPPQQIVILSDYNCALQRLVNPSFGDPLTTAVRNTVGELEKQGTAVYLQWIPGHVGVMSWYPPTSVSDVK
ncbi:putative nuclease HARBI1 [Ixodes scapularis]